MSSENLMPHQITNVMMIDDEKLNHIIVGKILGREDYVLRSFTSPLEAINELKHKAFDVILLDIVMPEMSGIEALEIIRKHHKKLPVIFLSSVVDDMDNTLLDIIAEDVYAHYVNKNKMGTNLLARIKTAVNNYRQEQHQFLLSTEITNEAKLAGRIQRLLLPSYIQQIGLGNVSTFFRPMSYVSGDFFGTRALDDDCMLFMIGDVSGHGMQSALYMTTILSLFNSGFFLSKGVEPHHILNVMNNYFFKINSTGAYFTCIVGIFDYKNNTFLFQNAGHPPFLHIVHCAHPDCDVVKHEDGGSIPVGWDEEYIYQEADSCKISFEDHDNFIFYSDGLFDSAQAKKTTLSPMEFEDLAKSYFQNRQGVFFPFYAHKLIKDIGYTIQNDDVIIIRVGKTLQDDLHYSCLCENEFEDISTKSQEIAQWLEKSTGSFALATKTQLLLMEFLQNEVVHSQKRMQQSFRNFILLHLTPDKQTLTIELIDRSTWRNFDMTFQDIKDRFEDENNKELYQDHGRGIKMILQIAETIRRTTTENANHTEFIVKNTPPEGV